MPKLSPPIEGYTRHFIELGVVAPSVLSREEVKELVTMAISSAEDAALELPCNYTQDELSGINQLIEIKLGD